jgi:hypothetical protein
MTARKPRHPTLGATRPRPSEDEIERRHRHVLRVFAQTAFACALIGGIFLLTGSHTLQSMALFLFAWAAGWGCASLYLLARRAIKSIRRRDER